MVNETIQKITDKAEQLYQVRQSIRKMEEDTKKVLDVLKAEKSTLQDDLIAELNEQGLSSIKVSSGDSFTKVVKHGVEVTNEATAIEWAIQNRAVNINKIVAGQILKNVKEMPAGFQLSETEYISVRKAKKENEQTKQ